MAASEEIGAGSPEIFVGGCALHPATGGVEGGFSDLDGERYYGIRNYDRMAPFFLSVVSDSNHWMFISSNGALTCGRRNPESALFPYTTDDKIHDARGQVGAQTILRVQQDRGEALWEPFSGRYEGLYELERNLYKNIPADKLVFEEINRSLGLSFRYVWSSSERFGFVRRATLTNHGKGRVSLRLVDGLRNILPANVDPSIQNGFSTLVDAYKKSELLPASGIGIFSLSSVPVDRAEPSESLLANIAWSAGLDDAVHLLCDRQLDAFRRGGRVTPEEDVRGRRGAYFLEAGVALDAGESREWMVVAEVDQDACAIAALERMLAGGEDPAREVRTDVERGTANLQGLVAAADGLQVSGDPLQTARHFSNTLCNIMRGGIFDTGYTISRDDLAEHLETSNRAAAGRANLAALPDRFPYAEGLAHFRASGDPDLERLYFEYLPLTFSRRHGDPSRPWNAFSIETRNPDGTRKLFYAGNWRDIFQNWEALGLSFPGFIEATVFKFVNASTADGYNPYRITRHGIDWEVHDPEDPWSNIGYWGDHQIVYLLKLLEHSADYHPGELESFLGREIFAYADIPYRIRPYEELLADPRDTIRFDHGAHEAAMARAGRTGSDGKLLTTGDGAILRVTLAEKLLVPMLAKLANFIPGAGIWMNTQRPEWNDANNALVGYGVSMVTLYHLRRYTEFCMGMFQRCGEEYFSISTEVAGQFQAMHEALQTHRECLAGGFDPRARRALLDDLGGPASGFRAAIYEGGISGDKEDVPAAGLAAFL
ncbi:MAG: hypothetical protein HKO57_12785, partial [Akkermansiaceae bacterium]|nr:hypothetical protein [Akkermansiaceae bacterium]